MRPPLRNPLVSFSVGRVALGNPGSVASGGVAGSIAGVAPMSHNKYSSAFAPLVGSLQGTRDITQVCYSDHGRLARGGI